MMNVKRKIFDTYHISIMMYIRKLIKKTYELIRFINHYGFVILILITIGTIVLLKF